MKMLILVCVVLAIVLNGLLFDYNLMMYFGKDVPWYTDAFCGTLTNFVNLSAAVVAFVLDCCGVASPFFKV